MGRVGCIFSIIAALLKHAQKFCVNPLNAQSTLLSRVRGFDNQHVSHNEDKKFVETRNAGRLDVQAQYKLFKLISLLLTLM